MSINSREKGKRGELELSHILQEYGYETRRGQQYSGANGDADVVGLPGIWIECKRVEHLNIDKALEQAKRDSQKTGMLPSVFHRKNKTPKNNSQWKVTMELDDWLRIYDAYRRYFNLD